jgi:hypothetical protein
VTVDRLLAQIIKYGRQGILIALLFLLAIAILAKFGDFLPIRTVDHITLAYLAGAYWLTKG